MEAVIVSKQKQEEQALKSRQQQTEREKQLALYQYSCDVLLQQLEPAIEQFNREFQHGQITRDRRMGFNTYSIPSGRKITVVFFEPKTSGIMIRSMEVIGGGWIGISEGRSANLVLLKDGSDDLYGRWTACEIGIMALASSPGLIGRYGLTERTVVPFGFKDAYFYDQIRYASGGMHIFTYNLIDDVGDFFAQLLLEACK